MTQNGNGHRPFNPSDHLMQLPSKNGPQDYLPVQWRLVWYRQECPLGTISTELLHIDLERESTKEVLVWNDQLKRKERVQKTAKGIAIFKATVTDGKGASATATGSESAVDFEDYIEKGETKAIGRSLALLGFGTQFAPELDEEHRIVDAPVKR